MPNATGDGSGAHRVTYEWMNDVLIWGGNFPRCCANAACEASLLLFIGKPAQGLQCAVRISDIQGGGRGAFVEGTFFRCGKGVNARSPAST